MTLSSTKISPNTALLLFPGPRFEPGDRPGGGRRIEALRQRCEHTIGQFPADIHLLDRRGPITPADGFHQPLMSLYPVARPFRRVDDEVTRAPQMLPKRRIHIDEVLVA